MSIMKMVFNVKNPVLEEKNYKIVQYLNKKFFMKR